VPIPAPATAPAPLREPIQIDRASLNRGAELPGPLTISSYDNGRAVAFAKNFGFRTTDYRRPSGASDLEPGEEIAMVLSLELDATFGAEPDQREASQPRRPPQLRAGHTAASGPRKCCARRRRRVGLGFESETADWLDFDTRELLREGGTRALRLVQRREQSWAARSRPGMVSMRPM
jgi:hypothetical protein